MRKYAFGTQSTKADNDDEKPQITMQIYMLICNSVCDKALTVCYIVYPKTYFAEGTYVNCSHTPERK